MEFRDGGSLTSSLIGSYCGNQMPDTIFSTGNEMHVRFRTDSSYVGKGFKVNYRIGNVLGYVAVMWMLCLWTMLGNTVLSPWSMGF